MIRIMIMSRRSGGGGAAHIPHSSLTSRRFDRVLSKRARYESVAATLEIRARFCGESSREKMA
jgi:hypothetical protein